MQRYKKYSDPMQDGRRKINPSEHKIIKELRASGMFCSTIAKKYGVSESLIKVIIYPRRQQSLKERAKRVWKDYQIHYGKKYHAESIAKNRAKKKSLGLAYNPCPISKKEKVCVFCGKKFFGFSNQKYCTPKEKFNVYYSKFK